MSRAYSIAQAAYLVARASFEVAKEAADAHMEEYERAYDVATADMDDDTRKAYDAMLIATAEPTPVLVEYTNACKALHAAERALLDWQALAILPKARTAEQRAAVEAVRSCRPTSLVYPKAIDLAMRLDPATL